MTLDAKEFTEEIDLFITEAEDKEKAEVVATADPVDVDDSEGTDDSTSGSEQEDAGDGDEVVQDDSDSGDPGTEAHEDGVEGDTGGVEGDEQEEPAAPAISDYAIARAASVGISSDDAGGFQSAEALLAEVRHLEDRSTILSPPPEPEAPRQLPDPLTELPTLDPEEFRPEVIAMFDSFKDVLKTQQGEIESFREAQNDAMAVSREVAGHEVIQWFDSQIKSLGEDFAEVLGEGRHGDLVSGTPQLAKRNEIADQCSVLLAGLQATGKQAPPREEVFRVAARLVLADEYESLHDKQISAGLKKQAGQHVSRANGRKTKSTQSPSDEIAALIDERYPPG
jgi:hypothetical protein